MPRPVINRKTVTVDAEGQTVGRLATKIARILMGKHKATFFPNVDAGDFVQVTHASGIKLTGTKAESKPYRTFSGYPGGLKTKLAKELLPTRPDQVIRHAVDRMLPKNSHRVARLTRLTFAK